MLMMMNGNLGLLPFAERKSCSRDSRRESMSRSRDQKDSSTMRRVRPSRGSRRRAVVTMAGWLDVRCDG